MSKATQRFLWLDSAKGLAILWIVYFHFIGTYLDHRPMPSDDWNGIVASTLTAVRIAWLKLSGLGLHAVSVFIILNGWLLMQSTARRASEGKINWAAWYGSRLLRLYPMYWVAHLVYLISPFVARWEPIDRRLILSLLGLRFVDIGMNFYYLNASWWFFSLLIQFYFIFPLLFRLAQRLGPGAFLVLACGVGFFVRYLMLIPYPQTGSWIIGGLALSRLPEFALGMALGMWHSRARERVEWFFLRGPALGMALLAYPAALQLYHNGFTYIFVDLATGASCLLLLVGIAGVLSHLSFAAQLTAVVGAYSYGIFLVHQPYVIWFGLGLRQQPLWLFPVIAFAVLAVLSAWGIVLEKATNLLVQKLLTLTSRKV